MDKYFFSFKSNIELISIPKNFNNPFASETNELSKIASKEVQEFLINNQDKWQHNFGIKDTINTDKGKMFGVLIVKNQNDELGYLFTVSGKLIDKEIPLDFVPSVFDDSTDNYFINRGMSELTEIGLQIKNLNPEDLVSIERLKTIRKEKSNHLQNRLFDHYNFLNIHGEQKNLKLIFEEQGKKPPAAAGECAAPKLIQYALEHHLKLIAITEFWWGAPKGEERIHKNHYPACRDKCWPILEFMLDDFSLYKQVNP